MYIDSLTITALVIFVVALGMVLRFCVFSICGGSLPEHKPGHRVG